jgi:ubiquinone/menaquinone biosynthesis C-methylase UbiE
MYIYRNYSLFKSAGHRWILPIGIALKRYWFSFVGVFKLTYFNGRLIDELLKRNKVVEIKEKEMSYVLKSKNEFERLESQSTLPNYDFKKELAEMEVLKGQEVLDACCGTGLVTRYLAKRWPDSVFFGCDIGEENLARGVDISKREGLINTRFVRQDITKLEFADNRFDQIVCRYAIQHLLPGKREKGIEELFRVLKPGGTLYVIDFDGTLYNLFPVTDFLNECFSVLKERDKIDLHIGRKIPHYLSNAGFTNIEFKIESLSFMENGLSEELLQLEQRFSNAKDFLLSELGGEFNYQRFVVDFFKCLRSPGASYFYNKFIIKGRK